MRRVQGNDGGLLGARDPEMLHLLGVKEENEEEGKEEVGSGSVKKQTMAKLRLTPCGCAGKRRFTKKLTE